MDNQENLFDKYGGVPTISLILQEFYKQLLTRMWAKKMFIGVDMDKLLLHQVQFVSFAMGKPESEFKDERLRKGHAGLGITDAQFDETVNILVGVLTKFKVDFKDIKLIGDAVESKRHLIVNVPKNKSKEQIALEKRIDEVEKLKNFKTL